MKIPIGCKLYSLRLADEPLSVEGKTCASVCDHRKLEILVSATVPEHLRMHVAAAAVTEAWAYEIRMLRKIPVVGTVN